MVVYWRRMKVVAPSDTLVLRLLRDGLRPGVPGKDIAGQVQGEQDRDDPRRQDDQLQLARVHQDRRSSTLGWCPGSNPARDVRRSGADDGDAASRPIRSRYVMGRCRRRRV